MAKFLTDTSPTDQLTQSSTRATDQTTCASSGTHEFSKVSASVAAGEEADPSGVLQVQEFCAFVVRLVKNTQLNIVLLIA